jgi:hypothetical protein
MIQPITGPPTGVVPWKATSPGPRLGVPGHSYLSTYASDAWLQANGFAADPAGNTLGTAAAHAIQRDVLSVGWAQLQQRDPAWSIALVPEDGLAIGVISRDPLQPLVSEQGDAQGSGEARDRSKKQIRYPERSRASRVSEADVVRAGPAD